MNFVHGVKAIQIHWGNLCIIILNSHISIEWPKRSYWEGINICMSAYVFSKFVVNIRFQ